MRNTSLMIRITGILTAFIITAVLCMVTATPACAEDDSPIGTAVCIANKYLTLRSEPSSRSRVAAKLPARTFVKVYAQSGKWYQVEYNGVRAWGDGSYLCFAATPEPSLTAEGEERTYTSYYQSDKQWKFKSSVKKKACVISSYAIMINNMGVAANPRFIYESNRRSTTIRSANLAANFGVTHVCALDAGSPYLKSFDGEKTYLVDPAANAIAAIKEAIDRNPEGVLCYFKKGSKAHAIIACKYDGDTIYYSDAGRTCCSLLTFKDTWVAYKHKLTYAHLQYLTALDTPA